MKRGEEAGLARRVYELHRAKDVKRGRSRVPIPTWEQLTEEQRDALVTGYARTRRAYDRGRRLPRETKLS